MNVALRSAKGAAPSVALRSAKGAAPRTTHDIEATVNDSAVLTFQETAR